jgi:hypothetical protein
MAIVKAADATMEAEAAKPSGNTSINSKAVKRK